MPRTLRKMPKRWMIWKVRKGKPPKRRRARRRGTSLRMRIRRIMLQVATGSCHPCSGLFEARIEDGMKTCRDESYVINFSGSLVKTGHGRYFDMDSLLCLKGLVNVCFCTLGVKKKAAHQQNHNFLSRSYSHTDSGNMITFFFDLRQWKQVWLKPSSTR